LKLLIYLAASTPAAIAGVSLAAESGGEVSNNVLISAIAFMGVGFGSVFWVILKQLMKSVENNTMAIKVFQDYKAESGSHHEKVEEGQARIEESLGRIADRTGRIDSSLSKQAETIRLIPEIKASQQAMNTAIPLILQGVDSSKANLQKIKDALPPEQDSK